MTKKKTTTAKAKAAEEVKTEETQEVKKPTEDVVGEDARVSENKDTGATISSSEGKDTSKEKEALKSDETLPINLTFNQAEEIMDRGGLVRLPEWKGFWFKLIDQPEKILVLTKDNAILDTPHEEYKERKDWQQASSTDEQFDILSKYYESFKTEKENKEANEEHNSLKAVAYNKAKDGSFIKLKSKISIEDLQKRTNLPVDSSRTSEFAMSNGNVFDLESGVLTNKKSNI